MDVFDFYFVFLLFLTKSVYLVSSIKNAMLLTVGKCMRHESLHVFIVFIIVIFFVVFVFFFIFIIFFHVLHGLAGFNGFGVSFDVGLVAVGLEEAPVAQVFKLAVLLPDRFHCDFELGHVHAQQLLQLIKTLVIGHEELGPRGPAYQEARLFGRQSVALLAHRVLLEQRDDT